jgi:hypothetical protein
MIQVTSLAVPRSRSTNNLQKPVAVTLTGDKESHMGKPIVLLLFEFDGEPLIVYLVRIRQGLS